MPFADYFKAEDAEVAAEERKGSLNEYQKAPRLKRSMPMSADRGDTLLKQFLIAES